jgi:DNA recombination protein RmuC
MELNVQITTETTNLTNALRGNSKVQGDWGEVILETILDSSNLIRGVHYQTQQNVKDEAGNNMRPDVVLYLPNNKQIIIDSKVSLTAYVNYVSAQTEAERRVAMAAHLASVRQHVKELSAKKYQQLMQSPDFVVMFVPNEPAFLDALKEDHTIWSDAYDKKVVVSSPTNLFALLKLVDDLWRRDDQNKNQENIIKFGVTLYEQLVAFTSALEGVGASLDQARTKYDEAFKRLSTGNNNIIRVGEKLRKLGLPTTKRQSARLVEESGADEDNNLIENE